MQQPKKKVIIFSWILYHCYYIHVSGASPMHIFIFGKLDILMVDFTYS